MGTDKALLELEGHPLLLHVAEKVAVFGPVHIVGDPARYTSLGLPVVPDNFPGEGPLAGIEAALANTTADHNLIVACDMPSLDENVLEQLFAACSHFDASCVLPRYSDGRVEPLCGVYHKRCHPAIKAALEQGIRKVTDAFTGFNPAFTLRYVAVDSARSFANLNTPEDFEKFRHG